MSVLLVIVGSVGVFLVISNSFIQSSDPFTWFWSVDPVKWTIKSNAVLSCSKDIDNWVFEGNTIVGALFEKASIVTVWNNWWVSPPEPVWAPYTIYLCTPAILSASVSGM